MASTTSTTSKPGDKSDAADFPDTARTYERAQPAKESAEGTLRHDGRPQATHTSSQPGAAEGTSGEVGDTSGVDDEGDAAEGEAGEARSELSGMAVDDANDRYPTDPLGTINDPESERISTDIDREEAAYYAAERLTMLNGGDEPEIRDLPHGDLEGSMHEEEPTGWDQAPVGNDDLPTDIHRHPRTDGLGGIDPADADEQAQASRTLDERVVQKF